ncbi:hypothetical protein H6G68_11305 [Anabaena catenula FACHB-362]|uniref:Uncharacterized protein n=2 Tax=Anabaena TaxID=1163 RepID=A0ABR8J4C4_9NOST|nr:hypothetical protein [Anabaena catenula FACHB-362]
MIPYNYNMTTKLIQKVIETVKTLPIEEQSNILQRWLYELETHKIAQSNQCQVKLSELLLLPELEETETLFERDQDTGRDMTL